MSPQSEHAVSVISPWNTFLISLMIRFLGVKLKYYSVLQKRQTGASATVVSCLCRQSQCEPVRQTEDQQSSQTGSEFLWWTGVQMHWFIALEIPLLTLYFLSAHPLFALPLILDSSFIDLSCFSTRLGCPDSLLCCHCRLSVFSCILGPLMAVFNGPVLLSWMVLTAS